MDGFNFWAPVDKMSQDVSAEGVVGMAGNVEEWTGSWSTHPDYPDLLVPIARGGSFASAPSHDAVLTLRTFAQSPKDANYAYVVIPNVTSGDAMPEQSNRFAQDVQIVSNTPQVQAVRNKRLGLTGIVFREAGDVAGVKVDQPCIVLVNSRDGKVAVSNPKNQPLTVKVTLREPTSKELTFDLPDGPMAGASVQLDMK